MKSPLIEKEICILLLQPIGSFWRTDFEKKWQVPSCKKTTKTNSQLYTKSFVFSLNLIDMVLETYDTPPPPKNQPTNLFIIIKHAFETATEGCCWPFLKATAFNLSSLQKTINCCWMNVSLSQTPTFYPHLIDQLLL